MGGNRGEAAAATAAIASDVLAEIGGVLHKRAALPMWSLGWDADLGAYDGRVALVIPGFGEGAPPSLGLVPVTHRSVACELAARLARGARTQPVSGRSEPGSVTVTPFEGGVDILGPVSGGEAIGRSMVHAMAMLGRLMEMSGYRPAGETQDALIELGLRVGELEYALNSGDFQFLSRGEAYSAIERAHDALMEQGFPRQAMASILRTVLDCGKLCGDRAAMMVGDDDEETLRLEP